MELPVRAGSSEVPVLRRGEAGSKGNRAGRDLLLSRQPHSAILNIEFACKISFGKGKASTAKNSWKIAKRPLRARKALCVPGAAPRLG